MNEAVRARIVVAGAGSIGCFVGGMLASAGCEVSLLARTRIADEIAGNGLRLTSYDGLDLTLPFDAVRVADDPAMLGAAALVLVTVKSRDTDAMAATLARHAPPDAVVLSLQNGVDNVVRLRERLPHHRVLAGMVPFNVVSMGQGRFHRATSGDIAIERDAAVQAMLSVPGLPIRASDDMAGVQWGKLLLNLNNAINALSGLPLREQLSRRAWRMILARQMDEALLAMKAAGLSPKTSPLPAALIPAVLRLPDAVFRVLAGRMLKIDPDARSSMWEDLQRGRATEIDHLQGAVVRLATRHGRTAPVCDRLIALVKAAEAAKAASPMLEPDQMLPVR